VDGEDWAREKWGAFARWYQLRCERIAIRTAQALIADARVVQRRYRERYGAETIFVPYGANVARDERLDALVAHGLSPRDYYLYVGRLVPENAVDTLIEAYRRVRSTRRLVIVGDAPYMTAYKQRLRELAAADSRILFTGYAFGDAYAQLSSHAYAYVQPSGVEGTRPALLDQMGFGNCVLVRDSGANTEVVDRFGVVFDRTRLPASLTAALQRLEDDPADVAARRDTVRERITGFYNWGWIADFHEDLFRRLVRREPVQSYDAFLAGRQKGGRCG
jgi:glycosyltransferase involved in cell wall biosynthesis